MFRFPSAVESVHSDHSPHQTDNGADLRKSLYRRKGRIGIFLFSGWQSYDTTGFSEGVLLDIVLEIFFFVLISSVSYESGSRIRNLFPVVHITSNSICLSFSLKYLDPDPQRAERVCERRFCFKAKNIIYLVPAHRLEVEEATEGHVGYIG
ncbi:hypothetical protein K445DRAFT_201040 [Daldinia sp. EC12]|nr:hypothetical protein K445DRAFT_201040 [Daldinia sp. EC12]